MRILWLAILLGSVIWAEEQHFFQPNATTWNEARLYCQACFKDLTTITSRNVHDIAQKLISDCWVGLRRSLNGSIPWSRWSNGDPVTYQNWYPGHPVPKVETCPLTPNSTSMNSTQPPKMNNTAEQCPLVMEILFCLNMTYGEFVNITGTLVTPTLYSTPLPTVNKTSNNTKTCDDKAEKYIEDSCVALLSFGMWKEKLCNESLPFICYDERFFGNINISTVNKSGGYLQWSPGPGNISHYRVEVMGGNASFIYNETALFKPLVNLTAGTKYNVQVYPVKCGRDLNPQNISFYTTPIDIYDLNVTNVTTNSVELSWNHSGNCDFFLIKGAPTPYEVKTTKTVIGNLTPGTEYRFTVSAVVNKTSESVSETVSTFTKPSRVKNLTSEDNHSTVVTVSWTAPEGSHTGYRVCFNETSECNYCADCIHCVHCNCDITTDEFKTFSDKTSGKKYCVCVAALTDNNNIAGEMIQINAYTSPKSVTLSLEPSDQLIHAYWTVDGCYKEFNLTIEEPGLNMKHLSYDHTFYLNHTFKNLKAAVNYTIKVITLTEKPGLESKPSVQSVYTKPTPPLWVKATAHNQTFISLTWGAPKESEGASDITYNVTCHSAYWKTTTFKIVKENVTFSDLQSGTNYIFSVSVVAGNLSSPAVQDSAQTKPNRQTITFAMLCTSNTALYCSNINAQNEALEKLKSYFAQNLTGSAI